MWKYAPVVVSVATLAAATLAGSAVMAAEPRRAAETTFSLDGSGGPGCPRPTVEAQPESDGSLTLRTSKLRVSAGNTMAICTLRIKVDGPKGWSFALPTYRYRGTAHLYKDLTARVNTSVFFTGETGQPTTGFGLLEMRGSFDMSHSAARETLAYLPCGADVTMNVTTTLALSANTTPSKLDIDSVRLSPDDLVWRECPSR
ncbi:hypothetical protein GCM10010124_11370 [Pilimelia terevasa]|uniref:DUF4360 domain-containing protein n=1 Tax=Pilimelia terevasa TaxID=53372 RepID=A0A8J3FFC5_9ACTN|nr:DUF4360 domain-containing protein [Pilimelia terevasa]GGK20481.1 hypothetical protein GCM10010124_11370 [Pilimelia terevasa]